MSNGAARYSTNPRAIRLLEEFQLVEELQSAQSLDDSLGKAVSRAKSTLPADDARVFLLDGENALAKRGSESVSLPLSGSSIQKILEAKSFFLDNSIGKLAGFYDVRELYSEGFRSVLSLPLVSSDKVFGVLTLLGKDEKFFDDSKVARAQSLSTLMSLAVANVIMRGWLKEKERLNQLFFEDPSSAILLVNEYGKVVDANANAKKLFGAIVGRSADDYFQASDFVSRVLSKKLSSIEVPSSSGPKLFELCASVSPDRKSVVMRFIEAGDKEKNNVAYEQVSEKSPDVVILLSADGKILFANDSAVELLDYSKKEFANMTFSELVFQPDLNLVNELMSELSSGAVISKAAVLRFSSKKGVQEKFDVAMRGVKDEVGRLSRIVLVARAVGGRSSMQKQFLDSVVNYASDAVYSFDTRGVVHSWSSSAEKIFGYPRDTIIGASVRLVFPQEREGELDEMLRVLNGKKKLASFETIRKRKNGELFNAYVSIAAITDESGKIVDYVEVVKDVTAERKMEEVNRIRRKLEERNRQLMELNEMKSVFISNVSHELRTPLTNIHGYSSLLLEGETGPLNEQQNEFMHVVVNETNRLTKLINDVLDLSKMDSGRFKLVLKEFDLRDLVEKCSCKSLAEKKGLAVTWDISPDIPVIMGDQNRIAQVLINLISNGIKFTETGGVTINVSRKSRNFVQVDVADTGMGIPLADQKSLFKRFYQVMRKDGQKQEGTGLGLAITKEIIKMHGGKIWVESTPGSGSKFSFILRTTLKKQRMRK
ncbi:PAS domain S-box protein [Candidatus Micrarchaeota archaeon]|nr:PAS domain S-box protein [Candidatus Micrarchaeota archaeon]